MADNVAITAGTGTTIATDDVSDVHYQRVKLVDGTLGETTAIAAGGGAEAGALRVTIANNSTGVVSVDDNGGALTVDGVVTAVPGGISIAVAPTVTAGAYSAKDAVGGEMTFANAVRVSGGSAVLNSVTIIDKSQAAAGLELWLFSATITEADDNAAFDISDAELATCVGVVPIATADYFQIADNEVACVRGVGLQFACAATSLFGQLKCTGTPTYASTSDLTVVLGIEYIS